MKDKPKKPRAKPLSLAHLTPEEAIRRAFNAVPKTKDEKPSKKAK